MPDAFTSLYFYLIRRDTNVELPNYILTRNISPKLFTLRHRGTKKTAGTKADIVTRNEVTVRLKSQ
jgi:hypothetical protein